MCLQSKLYNDINRLMKDAHLTEAETVESERVKKHEKDGNGCLTQYEANSDYVDGKTRKPLLLYLCLMGFV